MYFEFFHFTRPPFANTADPGCFYASAAHREALATLLYGVRERKGLCLLTGPVGSGKTLLLRKLAADNPTFRCLFLTNPWLSEQEFFSLLWQAWGEGDEPAFVREPLSAIQQALARQAKKDEALRFVLLADEAHLLPERLLEAVRLLLNLEDERGKLIQIVLSGQEELALILKQHHMRPLLQRVALVEHLRPFSLDDTIGYVQHRLRAAGGDPYLFSRPCLEWIHQVSRGVPRLINQICDHALIFAFGRQSRTVERQDIEAALAKLPLGAVFLEAEPVSAPQEAAADGAAKAEEPVVDATPPSPESASSITAADTPPEIPGLNRQQQAAPAVAPPFPQTNAAPSPFDVAALTTHAAAGPAAPPSSPSPNGSGEPVARHPLAWRQWLLSVAIALLLGAGGAYWWLQSRLPAESSAGRVLGTQLSRSAGEANRTAPSRTADPSIPNRVEGVPPDRSMPSAPSGESLSLRDGAPATGSQSVPNAHFPSALPLPVATHSTEQMVHDAKAALTAISNHFGADNTTVRDLFAAANPGVNLDRVTANTRIRLPQFRRTDMIVADQRGRFYLYYATLADDQQAAAVKQRLAPMGAAVVQLPAMLAGQTVIRLYLGPFTDFDEAARVADLVRFSYLPLLERPGATGS
ncbi:AAA family ATPase [Hydrogenophilus thiooxidans]|uniref:AAA family ATPase n=1 Tax=Hydrogenophilus thiooxidans TaxID=2820326 RepID=UPI001C217D97|nr:AAA family ATPase [Hydrogenophilus thiooxidans]